MSDQLSRLNLPSDLKRMSFSDLRSLADEVRSLIINTTSKVGGHLSSSLGAVELAVAIHAVYDSPKDKILWDVGHQAYAHKILTNRSSKFSTLRQLGGISGFPNKDESPHDVFTVGHASTSISSALGLAKARELMKENHNIVAVIGDGSLSGGLALEGINNLLGLKDNLVIVLNDNQLSISKNVGAVANYFTKLRTSQTYVKFRDRVEKMLARIPKIGAPLVKRAENFKNRIKHFLVDFSPGVIIEELGIRYLGPIDGHNIPLIMSTLQYAKEVKGPIVVHVITKKGKGYSPSEADPTKFHGIAPFKVETGELTGSSTSPTYTSVFGSTINKLAGSDESIVAITAAMLDGTGLEEFSKNYPGRLFDVGIAEEHAVTFAGGLARSGLKPIVAIYSTFLQRAYDEMMHDVCLQGLHVIFAVDRAGVVGEDGATHNGIFDIAYLRTMPGMVIMAPKDENELQHMLFTAVNYNGPIAIRYPRGQGTGVGMESEFRNLEIGKAEIIYKSKLPTSNLQTNPNLQTPDSKLLVIAVGSMVHPAVEAAKLAEAMGRSLTVVNARFVKPLDEELILKLANEADKIVTVEEGILDGGFGSAVSDLLIDHGINKPIKRLGLPDKFIEHGKRSEILDLYGLTPEKIASAL
jgi:1-deoxy-D-xylulose-5-phosphate synthase